MALPFPTKVVLPFDIATAQDMNERHANDVALANGSGIDDGAVTPQKRSGGLAAGIFNASTLGSSSITSLDFQPREIEFTATAGVLNDYEQNVYYGSWGKGVAVDTNGDGTPDNQYAMSGAARTNIDTGNVVRLSDNESILITGANSDSSENLRARGSVVSMNPNGFTYTLSMAHSTAYVYWVARA